MPNASIGRKVPVKSDSLRAVEVHTSPWEAHISRGLLESEGVPATLMNEHHVGANWPISLALGGVRVCVPAQYEGDAMAVLARRKSGEYETSLAALLGEQPRACPTCGGTEVKRATPWGQVLLALATLGIASVIFPPTARERCRSCGCHVDDH